jgi:type IV pilus assembly protein PilC
MPQFRYRARDREGKVVQGTIDSASEAVVATKILEMGYYPVEIKSVERGTGRKLWSPGRRVPVSEIVVFYRQLATMHDAGLPLIYSLVTLADGTTNRHFRDVVNAIRADVEGGETFSGALETHADVFDEVGVNMIRVGETSGNLSEVLERLAEYGERAAELRSRVKNALAYPLVLSVVATGVVGFSLVVVMPRFASIFTRLKAPLPLPTKMLMALSDVVKHQGWTILAGLVVLLVLFRLLINTKRGRWVWDGFLFRIPVFGELRLKNLTARFARNFGTLIESGVDILYAFEVCERTLGSVRLTSAIETTRERVREGESIAPVLEEQKVFPPLLTRMIGVGEETGRLGQLLYRVAGYYELELEVAVKRLTTLLEPMLVVVMAGVVAFIAAATLLPLFNMVKYMR